MVATKTHLTRPDRPYAALDVADRLPARLVRAPDCVSAWPGAWCAVSLPIRRRVLVWGVLSLWLGLCTGCTGPWRPSITSVMPSYRMQSPETLPAGSPAGLTSEDELLRRISSELPVSGSRLPGSETPRGPVLGVSIVGNKHVKLSEIQRHIKTRKDRNYDPQLVQEDQRRLYATNKFHYVYVDEKVENGGVHLTFTVVERPMIGEVLLIGNKYFSDKKLLKEAGLAKGDALNIYTVQEARRKIEEFYRSKGHSKTHVTIEEGDKASDTRVVLRIDEGPIERIWDVEFIGNDPQLATDGRLKTQIKSKPGFLKYLFRGRVDYSQIEEDEQRLISYYRGLGYFRAEISREIEYDDSNQWATLRFVINEGPRYQIRSLSVIGNTKYDSQELIEFMKLKQGDYFNLDTMQRDENELRDLYGSVGHIFADIKASPRFLEEPGQLDLVYQVKEGELFRVGKVNIHVAGDSPHTRRSVILNRLSLQPGDIVDIREVRASERRLKASQLFVTNPADGNPPRIVIRPPDLAEAAEIAEKQGGYRGQSPDSRSDAPTRPMVLDVFVPPLKSDQR